MTPNLVSVSRFEQQDRRYGIFMFFGLILTENQTLAHIKLKLGHRAETEDRKISLSIIRFQAKNGYRIIAYG